MVVVRSQEGLATTRSYQAIYIRSGHLAINQWGHLISARCTTIAGAYRLLLKDIQPGQKEL
jgi:hypothetical protein